MRPHEVCVILIKKRALMGISTALGVPMNWFFENTGNAVTGERAVVVRKGSRRSMRFTNLGTREELLSPNLRGPLELLLSSLEPGASTGEDPTVIPATRPGF